MCTTCGCSDEAKPGITNLQTGKFIDLSGDEESIMLTHDHDHDHGHDHTHPHVHDHDHSHVSGHSHDHSHDHDHDHDHDHADDHDHAHASLHSHSKQSAGSIVSLNEKILAKNDALAKANRQWLADRGIVAINLVSSPGSGKTTLLERTIKDLKDQIKISVVEGDQETLRDARRIKDTGCDVVQINTGAGCHLEADMLDRGLKELHPDKNSLVMIENVGNLVCPALFDLGEHCKVAILSVTEGEDKPLKYPHMFRSAEVLIINKTDLLPYVEFDVDACIKHALAVNPKMRVFKLSATKGDGLTEWYDWLKQQAHDFRNP
jgi:hydrogenase nickel incorporation protein HypB